MGYSQEYLQRMKELRPLDRANIEQEKAIPLEVEILLNEAEGQCHDG